MPGFRHFFSPHFLERAEDIKQLDSSTFTSAPKPPFLSLLAACDRKDEREENNAATVYFNPSFQSFVRTSDGRIDN